MDEYIAIASYLSVATIVFTGALLWNRYRKDVMRRFRLHEYRHTRPDNQAPQPH